MALTDVIGKLAKATVTTTKDRVKDLKKSVKSVVHPVGIVKNIGRGIAATFAAEHPTVAASLSPVTSFFGDIKDAYKGKPKKGSKGSKKILSTTVKGLNPLNSVVHGVTNTGASPSPTIDLTPVTKILDRHTKLLEDILVEIKTLTSITAKVWDVSKRSLAATRENYTRSINKQKQKEFEGQEKSTNNETLDDVEKAEAKAPPLMPLNDNDKDDGKPGIISQAVNGLEDIAKVGIEGGIATKLLGFLKKAPKAVSNIGKTVAKVAPEAIEGAGGAELAAGGLGLVAGGSAAALGAGALAGGYALTRGVAKGAMTGYKEYKDTNFKNMGTLDKIKSSAKIFADSDIAGLKEIAKSLEDIFTFVAKFVGLGDKAKSLVAGVNKKVSDVEQSGEDKATDWLANVMTDDKAKPFLQPDASKPIGKAQAINKMSQDIQKKDIENSTNAGNGGKNVNTVVNAPAMTNNTIVNNIDLSSRNPNLSDIISHGLKP